MPRKGFPARMDTFISKNEELISDYDQTEGTYPFECCKYEAIDKIQKLIKINKAADFNGSLKQALYLSIQYNQPVTESLDSMITAASQESTNPANVTQMYFNDIYEVYKKHDNNYDLEYCEENRDDLILLNTRQVIDIAKGFQGMGVPLEDLISIGNYGLCEAWNKYDPKKAKLKDDVLEAVTDLGDNISYDDIVSCIGKFFTYGKLKEKFDAKFEKDNIYSKKDLLKWIDVNVKNAKFSSVAAMWITARIKNELDENSRLVRKPKVEIYKDKAKDGKYKKETTYNLDAPIAKDTDTTFADTLGMEDETESELNIIEAYDQFKENLNKMLEGVSNRDRAVILYRYGIGLPRSLTPKEISDKQGLSIARISQIVCGVMQKMRENAAKYEIDPSFLFEACSKFR